ncbi:MAG: hypothetical protein IPM01_03470 [Burkholderiaceae bacterium]|nr:hypothetical protein [Burkholderiaceae bacterium]
MALTQSIQNGGLDGRPACWLHHRLANTPVKLDADGEQLNEAYVEAHSAFPRGAGIVARGSPLLLEISLFSRRTTHRSLSAHGLPKRRRAS